MKRENQNQDGAASRGRGSRDKINVMSIWKYIFYILSHSPRLFSEMEKGNAEIGVS